MYHTCDLIGFDVSSHILGQLFSTNLCTAALICADADAFVDSFVLASSFLVVHVYLFPF